MNLNARSVFNLLIKIKLDEFFIFFTFLYNIRNLFYREEFLKMSRRFLILGFISVLICVMFASGSFAAYPGSIEAYFDEVGNTEPNKATGPAVDESLKNYFPTSVRQVEKKAEAEPEININSDEPEEVEVAAPKAEPKKINSVKEFDIDNNKINVKFYGAFRGIDEKRRRTDEIFLCFVMTPKEDIYIRLNSNNIFDSKGNRYNHWYNIIGSENTSSREIIEGIPIQVMFCYNVNISKAGNLPVISRATVNFNDEKFDLRNLQVHEFDEWNSIKKHLGIN